MSRKKEVLSLISIAAAGTLWGLMGVFVDYFKKLGLDSGAITGIRVVSATVALVIFLLIADRSLFRIKLKDIWCFACTGMISLLIQTLFYFRCIVLTDDVAMAAVLLYTAPVFVMILSAIIFKEKITPVKAVSAVIAIIGCCFVTGLIGSGVSGNAEGILCGLASGLGYASYSIFSRFALDRGYKSLTVTLYTFIFGTIGTLPMMLIAGSDIGASVGILVGTGVKVLPMVIGIGVVSAALPYILYTKGLEGTEPGKASVTASVEPAVAALAGWLILGQEMGTLKVIGIFIVLAAIVLNSGVVRIGKKPGSGGKKEN